MRGPARDVPEPAFSVLLSHFHIPMPHATDAVVLRAVDYSDTSQVVTFWTLDAGRLTGIAKGAKRPRSAFGGPFDLFGLYRVLWREKPAGQLQLLTSADLLDAHAGLRAEPDAFTAAAWCAELLLGLTPEGQPVRPLYELLVETLSALGGSGPGPDDRGLRSGWLPVLFRFEAQALTHLGHRPRVAVCARCGGALDGTRGILFSPLAGGALCRRCEREEAASLRVRPETLALLDRLAEPGVPAPDRPVPPPLRQELRALLRTAYTFLLERPPVAMGLLPPA